MGKDPETADFTDIQGIMSLKDALQETEKKLISLAYEETQGNQQKVADLLGVDRSTITRKISQYNIKKQK